MCAQTSISLPRSKSIVIRCLIIHYLKTGTLLPVFDNDPNDIQIVYNALKQMLERDKTSVTERCVIDVEDCGTAYRFLIALLAAIPGKWLLTGTPRLLQRPIIPLVNFLNANGANIHLTELGWHIEGTNIQINDFNIDTSETSQFASAILMIMENGERRMENGENPYIQMTKTILQIPNLTTSYLLSLSDWSAAVFWIANALLRPNANYLLKDLHFDNLQGDAKIVTCFKKWGTVFTETEQGIELKHTHHADIPVQQIDVTQTPDIAMILAVLAVCYPFELTLLGVKNLNLKESNRLDIMLNELSQFTAVEKHSDNSITIHKRTQELPKAFHFNSYNDHRFVMAWSLFRNFGTVQIESAECVKKSYPEFLDIFYMIA